MWVKDFNSSCVFAGWHRERLDSCWFTTASSNVRKQFRAFCSLSFCNTVMMSIGSLSHKAYFCVIGSYTFTTVAATLFWARPTMVSQVLVDPHCPLSHPLSPAVPGGLQSRPYLMRVTSPVGNHHCHHCPGQVMDLRHSEQWTHMLQGCQREGRRYLRSGRMCSRNLDCRQVCCWWINKTHRYTFNKSLVQTVKTQLLSRCYRPAASTCKGAVGWGWTQQDVSDVLESLFTCLSFLQ